MKVATTVFLISIILAFVITAFKNQYAGLLPIIFIYIIATIGLFILNYIGSTVLKFNIFIVYPFSFLLSLLFLVSAITWLSGNSLMDTIKTTFLNRRDFISMADPYIIGNILTYILLLKRSAFSV